MTKRRMPARRAPAPEPDDLADARIFDVIGQRREDVVSIQLMFCCEDHAAAFYRRFREGQEVSLACDSVLDRDEERQRELLQHLGKNDCAGRA